MVPVEHYISEKLLHPGDVETSQCPLFVGGGESPEETDIPRRHHQCFLTALVQAQKRGSGM
jgi:hypothetical protein